MPADPGGRAAGGPASPADAAVLAGRHHRVRKDDSLFSIARETLGSGARWTEIYELNRDRLADPNRLPLDTVLRLPESADRDRIATQNRPSDGTQKD